MSDAAPHSIRLRGPWECQVLESLPSEGTTAKAGPLGRVTMPCDWSSTLGADFHGRVRFTRKFNQPTNLGSERVWLVIERLVGNATLALNGMPLLLDAGRVEVTGQLQSFNTLAAEFHLPAGQPTPTGPICDARLEIHA